MYMPRLFNAAWTACCRYIQRAGRPVPLLLVFGEPDALAATTIHWNGQLYGANDHYSVFDGPERVREMFDRMRKQDGRYRDGAMSFDPDGYLVDAPVGITCPTFMGMDAMYERISAIKGRDNPDFAEAGARHRAAAHIVRRPGIYLALASSEEAGTVIPFTPEGVVEDYVWRFGEPLLGTPDSPASLPPAAAREGQPAPPPGGGFLSRVAVCAGEFFISPRELWPEAYAGL